MNTLKNLYDFQSQDVPNLLDIRSDTILPLSSGNNKYVFRLEPNGYLDENSLILFKMVNQTADTLRVNCFNGGLGAIKRVSMSVGDWILNDVSGCDEWATLENFMRKTRTQQNAILSQYVGNQLYTKCATSRIVDGGGIEQQSKGEIIPDPVRSGIAMGGSANAASEVGAYENKATEVHSLKITTDADNNHQVGVPLGMIIPALRGRRIPLFLFKEYRIYITIELNTADKFVNNLANPVYSANQTLKANGTDITYDDVKLQVDYIIEPAEMIEKEKAKLKDGYVMDFYDVVRVEKQLPSGSNGVVQRKEFKIGSDNREVHKILMARKFSSEVGYGRNLALLNEQRIDGVNQESINWYVNGRDMFPEVEVNSNAILYDNTSSALGKDLDVERSLFFNSLDTQFTGLTSPNNPLNSTYKPIGVDMRNGNPGILGAGTTIGNYPIICKYARKPTTAVARSNAPQVPGFRNDAGAMNCNFYVMASRRAVITAGVKGNDVVVSY